MLLVLLRFSEHEIGRIELKIVVETKTIALLAFKLIYLSSFILQWEVSITSVAPLG